MSGGLASVPTRTRRAAKKLVREGPLRDSRVVHRVQRARAYRGIDVRPELTQSRELLAELDREGIAIVPGYVPAEQVAAMLAGADETIRKAEAGELADRKFTIQPDIVFRIGKVDELVPETLPFFEDATIESVMRAYLSPRVVSFRRELENRFGLSKMAQADLFHFDNWRPICKAFLYLVDVEEDNAPFRFIRRSHKMEDWRTPYAIEFDADGASGRYGHFFPQEIRALREAHPEWEEVVCTGKAGTLILADFRGLHRGTPLKSGRRVLLNNTFDLMNA
jgi:hypothetical protein